MHSNFSCVFGSNILVVVYLLLFFKRDDEGVGGVSIWYILIINAICAILE